MIPEKSPPSVYAIASWVEGEPSSTWEVTKLTAARAAVLTGAFILGGEAVRRGPVTAGVFASVSLTVFLTLEYLWNRDDLQAGA